MALILLIIALVSGQTDGWNALAWGIASVANVLGVPATDQIRKKFFPAKTDQSLVCVCQERGWTKDSPSEKFVLFIEEVGERGLCHAQGGWAV